MATKLANLAVCGLLLWAGSAAAQAQGPGSAGPGGIQDSNVTYFSMDLGRSPGSLDELIAGSKLVVEVSVISAFPATKVGHNPVSTDFVLASRKVLKGQLATDRFVVSQLGGELEGRKYVTSQYAGGQMSPGQRYILFLNDPDPRSPAQPQRDALVRFVTASGYLGVVLVEKDKVEFSSGLRFRNSYDGMSAENFMAEIATRVKNR